MAALSLRLSVFMVTCSMVIGIDFWSQFFRKATKGLKGTKGRIAIVRPTSPELVESLLSSFTLWDIYSPCDPSKQTHQHGVDLYISLSRQTESSIQMTQAFQHAVSKQNGWGRCFDNLFILDAEIPEEEDLYDETIQHHDRMWVNGPNVQFRSVFNHIRKKESYDCFLIMESDTYPLKKNWLDMMVKEVDESKPFGILGSKYRGHAWDRFVDRMPLALKEHINGNAFYNVSNTLLNKIVAELEEEKDSLYSAVSYDYRISQIVTEGSKGVLSQFPFVDLLKGAEESSALPPKMEKFQTWWSELGGQNFLKDSEVIANFGAVRGVIEDIGHAPVVHGRQYHPLKRGLHSNNTFAQEERRLQSYAPTPAPVPPVQPLGADPDGPDAGVRPLNTDRSEVPSFSPTKTPAPTKSAAPSGSTAPSLAPSKSPAPTLAPSKAPSPSPTKSAAPSTSAAPTLAPTKAPSSSPTKSAAPSTSAAPTLAPTKTPSSAPTSSPVPTDPPKKCPICKKGKTLTVSCNALDSQLKQEVVYNGTCIPVDEGMCQVCREKGNIKEKFSWPCDDLYVKGPPNNFEECFVERRHLRKWQEMKLMGENSAAGMQELQERNGNNGNMFTPLL